MTLRLADDETEALRRAPSLRTGPIAGPDFGSALIAVGLWQAMFFIALRGWPVNTISRRPHRLLAGNALVVGLGALTYLILCDLAHWQPDAISAACGCVISAALIVAMLFEGWPAARLRPAPGRLVTLALTALVARPEPESRHTGVRQRNPEGQMQTVLALAGPLGARYESTRVRAPRSGRSVSHRLLLDQ